jgi:hypothetical protein
MRIAEFVVLLWRATGEAGIRNLLSREAAKLDSPGLRPRCTTHLVFDLGEKRGMGNDGHELNESVTELSAEGVASWQWIGRWMK